MKAFKLTLVVMAAALITFGLSGTAVAFHGGGVAHCDGCHSMHGSDGDGNFEPTNSNLMTGTDASSTCLNCHEGSARSYHVSSLGDNTAVNYTQGGDFSWLINTYSYVVRGTTYTGGGDGAGHNIIAQDFGYTQDADLAAAPGGVYPSDRLGCTSCHDAHGQVEGGTGGLAGSGAISESGSYGAAVPTDGSILGNYRILGDSEYSAGNKISDDFDYTNDAPIARSNGSNGNSVDYGSGMSEWCKNCHTEFAGLVHVASDGAHLGAGYSSNYNKYVATGDFTGTDVNSYDALVPIERGVTVGADLDETSLEGADANSNVMCLTCHRAHASAYGSIGRWDFGEELIAESPLLDPGTTTTLTDRNAGTYDAGAAIDVVAEYGANQRSLCNKCHVQD